MAVNTGRVDRHRWPNPRVTSLTRSVDIFKPILKAKWKCFRDFRAALTSVPKGTLLLEYSRRAESETRNGKPPRWTANVKDGYLFGQNLCGRLMEMVREEMTGSEE